MARRKHEAASSLDASVDEVAVRLRATKRTFLIAGGVGASGDWNGPDGPWWERWCNEQYRSRDHLADPAAQVERYERAIERLDAGAVYGRELVRARRHAELNTPAARARRREES